MKPAARDYWLFFLGQAFSATGGAASAIALPVLILKETGSATSAGVASALTTLPYAILSVPAGALVDRYDRKRVMMICDTARGLAKGSLAVAMGLGAFSIAHLYAVCFVEGVFSAFFSVAERTALPVIAGPERFSSALSHQLAAVHGAVLVGPILGGLLYERIGKVSPFAFDALTFLVSILTLHGIRTGFQSSAPSPNPPRLALRRLSGEIFEGIRWLIAHPFIRSGCQLIGGLQLAYVAASLVTVALAAGMGASAAAIGRVFAAGGAGGLLGAMAGPAFQKRFGPSQVAVASTWLVVLLLPLFRIADSPSSLGLVYGLMCAVLPVLSVAVVSHRVRQTPEHLQARVGGIANRIMSVSKPVGSCAGGALLDAAGGGPTVLVLAAYLGGLALWFTLSRHTRRELSLERRSAG